MTPPRRATLVVIVTAVLLGFACGPRDRARRQPSADPPASGPEQPPSAPALVQPAAATAASPLMICRHPQDEEPAHRYTGPAWSGPAPVGDTVPLHPGLIVVSAIAMPNGDYESIKTIDSTTTDGMSLSY
jgi:hypothetical protein